MVVRVLGPKGRDEVLVRTYVIIVAVLFTPSEKLDLSWDPTRRDRAQTAHDVRLVHNNTKRLHGRRACSVGVALRDK